VLDYPDEDIEPFELKRYADTLSKAQSALSLLLGSFDRGRVMQSA
jgi:tRNA U34 5-carboxymethylaminomethyl modifying GTPase MnmE/TrmE